MKISTIAFGASVVLIVLFIVSHVLETGSRSLKDQLDEAQLKVLKHERDSLHKLTIESRIREQQYILRIEQDSIKGVSLQRSIALRESKIKSYQQRIDEMSKITISHPDSFLIRRYPK